MYKSLSKPGIMIRGIKYLMDDSDIQPYICNSSKLVHTNRKRRQGHESRINNSGGKGDKCEACGYELRCSTLKFCSIECNYERLQTFVCWSMVKRKQLTKRFMQFQLLGLLVNLLLMSSTLIL
ncbi:PLATZ transcription factor - like 4 [Theobroma cacao]|nr:PLATZ transcription factor - like 4 [Theobroma cacao]